MGHFDSLKIKVFDIITKNFGYAASWTSSESGVTYTVNVGYKDPSEAEKLSGIPDWDPDIPYMEYRIDHFPGLKKLVDNSKPEVVVIDKKGTFVVQEVKTKSDGDTFVARLIKT